MCVYVVDVIDWSKCCRCCVSVNDGCRSDLVLCEWAVVRALECLLTVWAAEH